MKAELYREMAQEQENKKKAMAFDEVIVTLNNAITYMMEQGESKETIAEYLGVTEAYLDAVDDEDVDRIFDEIEDM